VKSIADSDAFKDPDRVLPQHQAALTLLQGCLSNPTVVKIRWLDLACGRGQIVSSLDGNLSKPALNRLEYWGYDINPAFVRETQRSAEKIGFASVEIKTGTLGDFDKLIPEDVQFDFITLTNTVHEVAPSQLAALLVNCVLRLEEIGTLFAYDAERILPPELGAVPWHRDEIRSIMRVLLDGLGADSYQPEIGRWIHRTCAAWNIHLQRQHFGVTRAHARGQAQKAIVQTEREITRLLRHKHQSCQRALETLTDCGTETAEEQDNKQQLLYEYWALSRALKADA
jgi:SAM-dependent methyltransferase